MQFNYYKVSSNKNTQQVLAATQIVYDTCAKKKN